MARLNSDQQSMILTALSAVFVASASLAFVMIAAMVAGFDRYSSELQVAGIALGAALMAAVVWTTRFLNSSWRTTQLARGRLQLVVYAGAASAGFAFVFGVGDYVISLIAVSVPLAVLVEWLERNSASGAIDGAKLGSAIRAIVKRFGGPQPFDFGRELERRLEARLPALDVAIRKGSVSSAPGLQDMRIKMQEGAEPDTALEALAVVFLAQLAQDSSVSPIRKDLEIVLRWLGAPSYEALTQDQQTRWSRAYLAYLREGQAPTEKLESTYTALQTMLASRPDLDNVLLTDEIRGVMDRLLAASGARPPR